MKPKIALRLECPACGAELWLDDIRKFETLEDAARMIQHLEGCPNAGGRMVAARRSGGEQRRLW